MSDGEKTITITMSGSQLRLEVPNGFPLTDLIFVERFLHERVSELMRDAQARVVRPKLAS